MEVGIEYMANALADCGLTPTTIGLFLSRIEQTGLGLITKRRGLTKNSFRQATTFWMKIKDINFEDFADKLITFPRSEK